MVNILRTKSDKPTNYYDSETPIIIELNFCFLLIYRKCTDLEILTSNIEILYNTPSDIGGFQFDVEGVSIISASGGISEEAGFLVSAGATTVIGFSLSGDIIRITDVFKIFKEKIRDTIKPIGFISSLDKLLLSTNNGRLLTIDISSGKTVSILKIDNEKISRPFVFDKKLLLIKNNSIIRLN